MDSREIALWCIDNKKLLTKIALRYDKNQFNIEDNVAQLTLKLMQKGKKFNPNIGVKFSTYAYRILDREMSEYNAWKNSKLSYSHLALTASKYLQTRLDIEANTRTFGSIPDYIESHNSIEYTESIDNKLDNLKLKQRMRNIIDYCITPTQRNFFNYRYNDNFEIIHTFQECATVFDYSTARAAQLERKVIKTIKKYLYLDDEIIRDDKRRKLNTTKKRLGAIIKARQDNIWY